MTIDGKAATGVVASAASISATAPAGTDGAKSVVVTTVGGVVTKAGAFTYVPVPTIASVSPRSGPVGGGTAITIAGANLAGAKVTIGGVAATIVTATTGSISAKTPAGTVGAKSVVVTTVGGVATKLNGFTYTSSFTGDMPVAGGDSGAPARGAGSEHASAGHRGGDAAGAWGDICACGCSVWLNQHQSDKNEGDDEGNFACNLAEFGGEVCDVVHFVSPDVSCDLMITIWGDSQIRPTADEA